MGSSKTVTISKKKYKKLIKKKKKLKKELKMAMLKLENQNSEMNDNRCEDISENANSEFRDLRDFYFKSLIEELKLNANLQNFNKTIDYDSIALQLEQRALLASLKFSSYEKAIKDVIADVKNCNASCALHPILISVKMEEKEDDTQCTTNAHEEPMVAEVTSTTLPVSQVPTEACNGLRCKEEATDFKSLLNAPQVESQFSETLQPNICGEITSEIPDVVSNCNNERELLESDNQNTVINEDENVDIENLLRILEGTDQETESIDNRLEKMTDIFGYRSPNQPETQAKVEVKSSQGISLASQIKIYKNERYIFLYKVLTRCAHMPPKRFFRTRKQFVSFFGDDSDFEQEDHFSDYETFIASCSRRILPTVVKYVMPYHKEGRILGGAYMFKNLVRRIADSLVDLVYYPSESEVSDYVLKFFPPGKRFMDIKDIWCYQVD